MEEKKSLENVEIAFESEKSNLDELKESYSKLQKEFSLPDFDSLNSDFGIEKIQSDETDFLLREIRRYISDKIAGYLRFIESILQPSNSQMFVFMMIKSLNSSDTSKLQKLYKILAKKEIEIVELDLEFNSEKEVEFIFSSFKIWQEVKIELLGIIDKIKSNWDVNNSLPKDRNYYM